MIYGINITRFLVRYSVYRGRSVLRGNAAAIEPPDLGRILVFFIDNYRTSQLKAVKMRNDFE